MVILYEQINMGYIRKENLGLLTFVMLIQCSCSIIFFTMLEFKVVFIATH
jgi:hypothetical protein